MQFTNEQKNAANQAEINRMAQALADYHAALDAVENDDSLPLDVKAERMMDIMDTFPRLVPIHG